MFQWGRRAGEAWEERSFLRLVEQSFLNVEGAGRVFTEPMS